MPSSRCLCRTQCVDGAAQILSSPATQHVRLRRCPTHTGSFIFTVKLRNARAGDGRGNARAAAIRVIRALGRTHGYDAHDAHDARDCDPPRRPAFTKRHHEGQQRAACCMLHDSMAKGAKGARRGILKRGGGCSERWGGWGPARIGFNLTPRSGAQGETLAKRRAIYVLGHARGGTIKVDARGKNARRLSVGSF